jgi:hypothetical protein
MLATNAEGIGLRAGKYHTDLLLPNAATSESVDVNAFPALRLGFLFGRM